MSGINNSEVIKMVKEKDFNERIEEMLADVEFISDEQLNRDTKNWKIGVAQKGKIIPKESIEKMRKSLTGKPWNSDLKYTDEELIDIAKKYNRRQDFKNNDRNAYKAVSSRGKDFFNKVCAHMVGGKRVYGTYTIEELKKRAKKFKSRGDFVKGDKAAYHQARKMNILDEVCKHMKRLVAEKWTEKSLIAFIKKKKIKTRTQFNKEASGAYTAAWKMKILDKLFPKK